MKRLVLPRINLGKLSHDEIQVLLKRIIEEWEKQETVLPLVELIIYNLTKALTVHRKVMERERGCDLTKQIHELDELRDRAYRLLIKKIRTSQEEFDQALVSAGAALLPVVEKFDSSITDLNLAEETGVMIRALDEFKKPEYAPHHAVLGTLPYVDHSFTYNSDFEKLWNERSVLGDTDADLPLMREVRTEIEKLTRILLKNGQFLIDQNHASLPESLVNLLDTELQKMATLIKLRENAQEESAE